MGKHGCVANAEAPAVIGCGPNEYWNGGGCVSANTCQAGEFWNGFSCAQSTAACAGFNARAAAMVNELMGLKGRIRDACSQNSQSQECDELKLQQAGALQRYEMLLTEAGPGCRTAFVDPASLQ
jgi:hypothetical protein